MKAIAKIRAAPGLELIDVDIPAPQRNEVLVRVDWAGICGTDLHLDAWDDWAASTTQPGFILGHEFAGHVVSVGDASHDDLLGKPVTAEGHLPCMKCSPCLGGKEHLCAQNSSLGVTCNGAFAEFIALPRASVRLTDPNINPQASALMDPLGNVVHALDGIDPSGKSIIITGAGPLGLLAVALLHHLGASRIAITDLNASRLTIAAEVGATEIYVAPQAPSSTGTFDLGLEMSGSAGGLADLVRLVRAGGDIRLLGLPTFAVPVDIQTVITKMLSIRGVYGRHMTETWKQVTAVLQSGFTPQQIVTDVYAASDWQEAFRVARRSSGGKILLDWRQTLGEPL